MEIIVDVIHTTLYDQFGQKRIDDDLAEGAYQALLRECKGTVDHLLIATTNYDRAAESALRNIGWSVTTGFEQRPYRSPSLRPAGMVKRYETETPVIHLHGAVGWYENEGTVIEHSAELDYNHTLGTPVVLYPDPNKEPTTEEVLVYQLWQEFDRAIDIADMVLVIGHSLHDPPLVDALGRAIKARKPVVVSYLNQGDEEQIDMKLPDALVVQMNFGPQLESSTSIQELIRKHAS